MARFTVTGARLDGCAIVLGEDRHLIDDEPELYGNDPDHLARLKNMIGLGTRYTARQETTTADLCALAASSLLRELDVDAEEIGALVSVTQTPDYPMPGNAHVLHGRLGLPKDAAALDVGMGCSGFVYGLWLAAMAVAASTGQSEDGNAKKALLVAGDTLSKVTDKADPSTFPLFGDAGSAVLLSPQKDATMRFILRADGSRLKDMLIPAGGARNPMRCSHTVPKSRDAKPKRDPHTVQMDGFAIFHFAMTEQPRLLRDILAFSGMTAESIDYFIFHQANRYIVETIAKKAGIPPAKAPSVFSRFGNLNAASIPGVLCSLAHELRGRSVQAVLQGYGTGLSWGACQGKLDRITCLPAQVYSA